MDGLVVAPLLETLYRAIPPIPPRRRNESARHHGLKKLAAALLGGTPHTEVRYPGGMGRADVAACGVYVECGQTDTRRFAARLQDKRVKEIWWLPYVGRPLRYRRGPHFFEQLLAAGRQTRLTEFPDVRRVSEA